MAHVQKTATDSSKDETETSEGGQNGIDSRNGAGNSGGVIGPSSFVFGENMESRVLKRPAEEQLDRKTSEKADDETDKKKEEPGEFPKASPMVMAQRPILFAGSAKDTKAEKEEVKSSFKLNPPTLVHGKAKPAPKTASADGDTASPAKPLLRPSPLCHTSPHWATLAAVATGGAFKLKASSHHTSSSFSQWNGKDGKQRNPEDGSVEVSSSSASTDTTETPTKGDGGTESSTANGKPKMNFFIKLSASETDRDRGFGVFGSFSNANVGFAKKPDHNGTTNENYFLQFAKVDSSKEEGVESPKGLSNSGNSFVFGQNMDERVVSPQQTEKESQGGTSAQFGSQTSLSFSAQASPPDDTSPLKSQETTGKSLLESASAYEKAKKSSEVTFEEVTSRTGEEDEENVFQAQCKLFVFDAEKHSWQERGRGLLRLNDQVPASSEQSSLQSRLVMRTQGSLRVVLNTKIWSGMTIEKASPKNIRLSARDGESDSIRVFLVSASPKDAEQIYRAIEYRVQELKYNEQQQAERAKEEGGAKAEEEEETAGKDEDDDSGDGKQITQVSTLPVVSVDSDDSVSQSNSALTDRSSPEPSDPRIEGNPETPPASN
ncbi:ran-binding protein 3-like isoform X2 [Acanthaster planci]|uniref:Ran-binding protein 3-like isoform X2 n=1 Tax=Acanthaster planci TaxID=133434 RepID=A0A8B7ZWE1_ACAPL|nr:ran-binding protein 3-like isoform X2 [Acanthaster planci]